MKYICAQPATFYYGWQLDTMLYNFREIGINLNDVHVICGFKNSIDNYFLKLEKKYGIQIFYYQDTRKKHSYKSSLRPHILAKHFENHTYLEEETIFYHDNDILFVRPIELSKYLNDDVNYLSDTIGYIGHDYILNKGKDVLNLMCSIMGICSCKVKANQHNSGGAQYLLKNITADFWKNVEEDCENLYYGLTEYNKIKKAKDPKYNELQIWCADMWALLWNLWKNNSPTKIIEELNFVWPNEPYENIQTKSIIHNAGVINNNNGMFYKADYVRKLPNLFLKIDNKKASYFYYNTVKKALSC